MELPQIKLQLANIRFKDILLNFENFSSRKSHPENIFIFADVLHGKVRIISQISKEKALLNIFQNNLDFHFYIGSFLKGLDFAN